VAIIGKGSAAKRTKIREQDRKRFVAKAAPSETRLWGALAAGGLFLVEFIVRAIVVVQFFQGDRGDLRAGRCRQQQGSGRQPTGGDRHRDSLGLHLVPFVALACVLSLGFAFHTHQPIQTQSSIFGYNPATGLL
jgi:hypothetical protein